MLCENEVEINRRFFPIPPSVCRSAVHAGFGNRLGACEALLFPSTSEFTAHCCCPQAVRFGIPPGQWSPHYLHLLGPDIFLFVGMLNVFCGSFVLKVTVYIYVYIHIDTY